MSVMIIFHSVFSFYFSAYYLLYLGSLVTEDGRCTKEVRRRIALAKLLSAKGKNC